MTNDKDFCGFICILSRCSEFKRNQEQRNDTESDAYVFSRKSLIMARARVPRRRSSCEWRMMLALF